MNDLPEPLPLYVEGTGEPVFAILHPARPQAARDTAVVICPPFGWAEISSYRALRAWAQHLAAAGYSTLRISLPSTGDSGGAPDDPRRTDAWCAALIESCSWLRSRASARRVAVVGLGLGGLIACRAAAENSPIDELVLWATPAHGRAIVRELKATARLEASQCFDEQTPPPPLPDGELDATGFQVSAETVAALSALDVRALSLAGGSPTRALLLERDGIAVDQGLQDWLRGGGVGVTTARGAGYGAMTTHPQQTQAPVNVFARTTVWLGEASSPATSTATGPGPLVQSTRIEWAGGALMERPIFIDLPSGRLPGVLSEPLDPGRPGVCGLLLNAGGIRRIGPGRMWVEAARRWALQGVPTIRLDLEGIGDADGELNPYAYDGALYVPKLASQAAGAVEALHELGLGERFVLGGLCSGAFWSFHTALEDPRVIAAYLLNPRALFWEESVQPGRDFRRGVLNPSKWRKLRLIPRARYIAFARWVLRSPVRLAASAMARALGRRAPDRVGLALDRLSATRTHLLLLFSEREPLYEELMDSGVLSRLERWPNITLELVIGHDHTLRPLISQRQAHEALDRALARDLAVTRAGSDPGSAAAVHDRAA
jgi:pimeloyl-ACP methyl ester carboxylesterase